MAGTNLGTAYVQIMPSAKGIKGSITKELNGEATSAGTSAGSTIGSKIKGAVVAAGIGAAIGTVIKSAVSEGSDLEQTIGGIETLFKDSAKDVQAYAANAYKTAGISANEYMQTATSFSASLLQGLGGDTQKAAKITDMAITDMSDNANKMGTDMASIQNAYQGFAKQNYTMLDNLKLGYGGTKTEMERLLADAEKITGVKYDINNLSDVYSAIHAVQGELGITGTTAEEAASTMQGSLNSVKASWTDLMGAMAMGGDISSQIQNFADSAGTFLFDNLLPMVETVINNIPPLLSQLIPKLAQAIPQVIQAIVPTLIQSIPMLLDGILQAIPVIVNGILGAIPMITAELPAMITGIADALCANLPIMIPSIIDGIIAMVNAVTQHLPEILQALATALPQILQTLITSAISTLPTITIQILPGIISAIIGALPPLLEGIWNTIKATFQGCIDGVGQLFQKIKDLIAKPFESAKEKVKGIIDKIKGFFNFTWSLPKLKLPHFSISPKGWSIGDLLKGKIPSLGINWYANGGIMTKPTIFGSNGNNLNIGGEAGAEGIIPLNQLWQRLDAMVSAIAVGMENVAQSNREFAFNIPMYIDGREVASATAKYTEDELAKLESIRNMRAGVK